MNEITQYSADTEVHGREAQGQRQPEPKQKDSLLLQTSKHPMIVGLFGFVLVGLIGGTIQQNQQRKTFALERQLSAIEQIIDRSLTVQRNIRVLTDDSGIASNLSPAERSLKLETRHLIDSIAVDFAQTSPLSQPGSDISDVWGQYRNAIACVGSKLDRQALSTCKPHIVFDAADAVVLSGRMKREFLNDTFRSVSAYSYLRSLFGY